METRNKFFIVVMFTVLLFAVFVLNDSIIDKRIIPISFFLAENTGFGHIEGELLIGAITTNQSGSKNLVISNTFGKPVKVSIESSGEVVNSLIVSENNFELKPGESKDVSFTVYTHGLTEYREYRGKVIIISRTNWDKVLERNLISRLCSALSDWRERPYK